MRSNKIMVLGAVTLSMAIAETLAAQTATRSDDGQTTEAVAREYEQRAIELHADPAQAAQSARLHRKAAQLRAASDPAAVKSLAMAAHLFGYARKFKDARATMEAAAERALAMGDVVRAAQAYVDAAFFADREARRSELLRLGTKAVLLTHSPLMSDDQRSAITDRVRVHATLASLLQ